MGFHSNEMSFKPQRFSDYLHIAHGNMDVPPMGFPHASHDPPMISADDPPMSRP
jgi:hypothetical protein